MKSCYPSVLSLTQWNANQLYLWGILSSIPNSFFDLHSYKCFTKRFRKEQNVKLRICNGGWHVKIWIYFMKVVAKCYILWHLMWIKTKKCQQTLENAQYRLEIIFKLALKGLHLYRNNMNISWLLSKLGEHCFVCSLQDHRFSTVSKETRIGIQLAWDTNKQ